MIEPPPAFSNSGTAAQPLHWREPDRVDEDVEAVPARCEVAEQRRDLLVAGHVAGQHRDALVVTQRRDQLDDVPFQPVAGVREGELGTLALERRRDAPRDAALVRDAPAERPLAVEQTA